MANRFSGLLSRYIPGGEDLSEQDRSALARQGLLALAGGILGSRTGGNFGAALGQGLTSGLLAVNQGADDLLSRRIKQAQVRAQIGGGTGYQEFQKLAQDAGYTPGSDEFKRAAQVRLGTAGRASSAGYAFDQEVDANGIPRPARNDPRTGSREVFIAETGQWMPLGGQMPVQQAADGQQVRIDPSLPPELQQAILANPNASSYTGQLAPSGIGLGRSKEQEAGAVAAAQEAARLAFLPQQLGMQTGAAIQQAGGTAEARARTENAIAAEQALPGVQADTDQITGLIDKALSHPGLSTSVGLSGKIDPRNYIPGTDARNFGVLLEQLQGNTFLQAFERLKGGGAITEIEGKKAESAIARLNSAQSEPAFREALGDLRSIAQEAVKRAKRKVGGSPALTPQRSAPKTGGWSIQRVD